MEYFYLGCVFFLKYSVKICSSNFFLKVRSRKTRTNLPGSGRSFSTDLA